MQISLNKNETKGNLEYYCTFPGSCQSLLSAVASLHPGDRVEKQGLVFWKGWTPKILLSGCVGTKSLKATPGATIGLSQRVFPRMVHQRSASHQRSLASTLLVLFLGDYLSCVCLCVCLCMCVLRANAMQAGIKKKGTENLQNRANKSLCSCHWRQWRSFSPFSPSASCFPCLLFPHSVSFMTSSFSSGCALCLLWVGGHPSLKQYTNPEWRADAVATQSNGWSSLSLISSSHGWNGLLGNILRILP